MIDVTQPPYNVDHTGTTIDTKQIQAAVTAAASTNQTIYFPYGTYRKNYMITVPINVRWLAEGIDQVTIIDTVDLGVNTASIVTDFPGYNPQRPEFSEFTLVGPGSSAFNAGFKQAQMFGLGLRGKAQATRIRASGYAAGIAFQNDHQTLDRCYLSGNYDGAYYAYGGTTFGNQMFHSCELVGNNRASIGIHNDNMVDACYFIGCHMGFGPYCFYKEGTTISNVPQTGVTDCVFAAGGGESVGNGFYFDEAQNKDFSHNTFTHFGMTWDTTRKIPNKPADWVITAGSITGMRVQSNCQVGMLPGAKGYFNVKTARNIRFDMADDIIAHSTPTQPIFAPGTDLRDIQFHGSGDSSTIRNLNIG